MRTQQPSSHARQTLTAGRFNLSVRTAVLALVLALGWVGAAGARSAGAQQQPPVSVQVSLDHGHATVGDPIGLTITIRYPSGAQVDTSGIQGEFGDFAALGARHPISHPNGDGTTSLRLSYQVAAYTTGELQFPAITVPYTLAAKQATATSTALPFRVDSVIPAGDPATDIRALKPQIELQAPAAATPWRRIGIVAAVVMAVLLLALLLGGRVRDRRRRLTPAPAPSVPPLEAEARAELDRIVAAGYLARGDYAAHYARVAECIRGYVARRYGFPATALTTAELQERMVLSGVGRWRARLVSGLLSECDAVHYARYVPAPARAEADLEMAYEVVDLSWSQETRPEETLLELVQRN
jgi:hypothetical protein